MRSPELDCGCRTSSMMRVEFDLSAPARETRLTRSCLIARMMLERMVRRGACGCDNDSGDGAGVLNAIPDDLYRKSVEEQDMSDLLPIGHDATGILFLEEEPYKQAKDVFQGSARVCGLRVSPGTN